MNEKAIRLVEYLIRLASLRTRLIRDIDEYEKKVWVSSVPHDQGCFTRAWWRDAEHEPEEWLEVQSRREPVLPTVPTRCSEWVDRSSFCNKNDHPKLLAEVTRQVPNPDWLKGSDQPERKRPMSC
jgi:hypothetical protein